MLKLISQKMGIHEWSYDNEVSGDERFKVPLEDQVEGAQEHHGRSRTRLRRGHACKEAERCLNCDVQTVFAKDACIECDACVDICPMDCITFTGNDDEPDLRQHLSAPALNLSAGPVRVRRR